MNLSFLKAIPWRKVAQGVSITATAIAGVLGAMEHDETTQKVVKKVASKLSETMGKKS
jgi:hypothetical protein